MRKIKTINKDLEVRLALTEQGFEDIKIRLNIIEADLKKISEAIVKGLGAWRAALLMCSFIGGLLAIILKF